MCWKTINSINGQRLHSATRIGPLQTRKKWNEHCGKPEKPTHLPSPNSSGRSFEHPPMVHRSTDSDEQVYVCELRGLYLNDALRRIVMRHTVNWSWLYHASYMRLAHLTVCTRTAFRVTRDAKWIFRTSTPLSSITDRAQNEILTSNGDGYPRVKTKQAQCNSCEISGLFGKLAIDTNGSRNYSRQEWNDIETKAYSDSNIKKKHWGIRLGLWKSVYSRDLV